MYEVLKECYCVNTGGHLLFIFVCFLGYARTYWLCWSRGTCSKFIYLHTVACVADANYISVCNAG